MTNSFYKFYFFSLTTLGLIIELIHLHSQVNKLNLQFLLTQERLLSKNEEFLLAIKQAVLIKERKVSALSSFWSAYGDYVPWVAGALFLVFVVGGGFYLYSNSGGSIGTSGASNLGSKSIEKTYSSESGVSSPSSGISPEAGPSGSQLTDSTYESVPTLRHDSTCNSLQSPEILGESGDLGFNSVGVQTSNVLESNVEDLAEAASLTTNMVDTHFVENFTQTDVPQIPPHSFITHEDVLSSIGNPANNTTFLVDNFNTRYLLKIYPMGSSAHPLQGGLEIFLKTADNTVYTKAQNLGEVYMRFMENGPAL